MNTSDNSNKLFISSSVVKMSQIVSKLTSQLTFIFCSNQDPKKVLHYTWSILLSLQLSCLCFYSLVVYFVKAQNGRIFHILDFFFWLRLDAFLRCISITFSKQFFSLRSKFWATITGLQGSLLKTSFPPFLGFNRSDMNISYLIKPPTSLIPNTEKFNSQDYLQKAEDFNAGL